MSVCRSSTSSGACSGRCSGPGFFPRERTRWSGTAATKNLSAIPNPSTRQALILYRVSRAAVVTVEIFDSSGSLVRRLAEGPQVAGSHVALWNGRNEAGVELPSGVYLTRIETPLGVATGKVVLARR